MKLGVIAGFLLVWQSAGAMGLQEYLKVVESKNKNIQSLDVSKEAADLRQEAGDISLVPYLTANVGYLSDKSPLSQFALLGATEAKTTSYMLGVGKKFSSGTSVDISATAAELQNEGNLLDPRFARFGTSMLGISLSQSLWKDSFGHATRLRHQREEAATAAEKGTFDLKKKQLLVEAEVAYWNFFLASEALRIGRDSLARAQKIEGWTKRRVGDGISDRADLLETQGLVYARQLQLISVQDDLDAAKQQIRDFMELGSAEAFPQLEGDITKNRPISSMIDGHKGRVVALQAYLAALNAKARSIGAREVEDAYRPDLVLAGSYTTNTFEPDLPEAVSNIGDTERPTAKIGLNFVYLFDTDVKSAAQNASRKEALAAKLQSERAMIESDSAWLELNRRYVEMSRRIEAADQTVKVQMSRVRAQNDLFNKGRSITFNVVNAEEDAASAELNLYRLRLEQRKMEAQGRLFVSIEDSQL